MPVTPNRKPSVVSDRRQSILGEERVIQSTGIHVDPDENYMDHRKPQTLATAVTDCIAGALKNPETIAAWERARDKAVADLGPPYEDLGICPIKNEGERYFESRMEQQAHEAAAAIKIEPAPPIPSRFAPKQGSPYPITQMKPGDFIFIPSGDKATAVHVRSFATKFGIKVTVRRKFLHKGSLGVGVWAL